MKKLLLLITLTILLTNCSTSKPTSIQWAEETTFDEIIKKADKKNKIIMIDMYTDWCHWCKVLDEQTYPDSNVVEQAYKHLICVKRNGEDKAEGTQLVKKYNVNSYPCILFIDTNGEEIERINGYLPPEEYVIEVDKILKGEGTLPALLKKAEQEPNNLELLNEIAQKYSNRGKLDEARSYWDKVIEQDPNNSKGALEEALFANSIAYLMTGDFESAPEILKKLIETCPDSKYMKKALDFLILSYERNDQLEEAISYSKKYMELYPDDAMMYNNLAMKYVRLDTELDEALKLVNKALELAPNTHHFLDTKAEIVYKQGNKKEAVELIEIALQQPNLTERETTFLNKQLERFKQ